MTYGTRQFKNGKVKGYLTFNTGKKVYLNERENAEFNTRLRFIEAVGKDKEKARQEAEHNEATAIDGA